MNAFQGIPHHPVTLTIGTQQGKQITLCRMLYFNREEIDKWLLQNKQEVIGMVTKIEIDNPKE